MSDNGDFIKSMVYGGMDGIITTFAIVCAASGAGKDNATIVTMGVANVIADAISMGMGDYISDCAEHDYAVLELSRKRDLARLKSKEQQEELVKFYREKNVNEEDAKVIVARVAKYPELFAEQLVKNVVGMQPPEEDGHRSSVLKGIITFVSFLIFGIVPLLPFILQSLIQDYIGFNPDSPLAVVCIASGMTMFVLGAIAGTVTEQNQLRSGMFLAAQGLLTAYAAYAVGKALESFQLSTSPGVHGSEL